MILERRSRWQPSPGSTDGLIADKAMDCFWAARQAIICSVVRSICREHYTRIDVAANRRPWEKGVGGGGEHMKRDKKIKNRKGCWFSTYLANKCVNVYVYAHTRLKIVVPNSGLRQNKMLRRQEAS